MSDRRDFIPSEREGARAENGAAARAENGAAAARAENGAAARAGNGAAARAGNGAAAAREGARAETAPAARRWSMRQVLRELDPRVITRAGPVTPLVVLGLFALVTQWDDNALGILLPDIRTDFKTDLSFILTLQAVLAVVTQLLAPFLGYIADRVPRVRMLRAGALLANAASIATGFAPGIGFLAAGRTAVNVGNAVLEPVGFPLATDYYPPRVRARLFAFLSAAGYIGAVAGPVLGGNLGALYGWRVAVISLGGASLAVSLLTFLMREPRRGALDRIAQGASPEAAAVEQEPVSWAEGWRAARATATIRRLWYAAPFLGATGFAVLVLMGFYYADEFGVGPQGRGTIAALGFLAGAVATLASGPIGDRLIAVRPARVMTLMGVVLVLQAGAFVLLWLSPWLVLSVAINLALAFLNAVFLPALYTLLSLTVPARIRGLGMQTVRPFYALGALIVPVVNAVQRTGGLREALLIFPPVCLIGAVILGTAAKGVDEDIRAARAAVMADEEGRRVRASGQRTMLACRGVEVKYDGVQVLFGVDLDIERGEIVALLGTNGAGKSTLLRAIAGVSQPSGGAIFLDGRDITHVPPHETAALGVVLVPGGRAIFSALSVGDNLRAAAWLARVDDTYVRARTDEVLELFPALRARLNEQAGALSGGEQQMLAIGQAFLMKPELLMIDELSLGVAPGVVAHLLDIVRAIAAQGTAVVLVEQSVNVALTVAARAVFMEKGTVRFTGATADLLHRSDVMRSVFLGDAAGAKGLTVTNPAPRADRKDALLEGKDLSVAFGGVAALRGANVRVGASEIVGVIGPNGAGKTTLFDVLSGVVQPDAGRVLLDGTDVTMSRADERARRGLGRSFQTARLFPTMTARDAIAVAFERHLTEERLVGAILRTPRVRTAERRTFRRVDELIDLLGLGAYAGKFVGELSTATRRVVDIACVMAARPSVLLLDEPSSGLAQAETTSLGDLFDRVVRETGCGMLIIEHDIALVTSLSHRMLAMDHGAVVVEGDARDVIAHPQVVASYLGTAADANNAPGRTPSESAPQ